MPDTTLGKSEDSIRDEVLSLLKELKEIKSQLLSEQHAERHDSTPPGDGGLVSSAAENSVRKEILRRAERCQLFPSEIFGEPAWNILLELYLSDALDRPVTVSNASNASGAPNTTALRWISMLVEADLIEQRASELDRRVILLRLTENAKQKLNEYFGTD